jgi:hypothetical protein
MSSTKQHEGWASSRVSHFIKQFPRELGLFPHVRAFFADSYRLAVSGIAQSSRGEEQNSFDEEFFAKYLKATLHRRVRNHVGDAVP